MLYKISKLREMNRESKPEIYIACETRGVYKNAYISNFYSAPFSRIVCTSNQNFLSPCKYLKKEG